MATLQSQVATGAGPSSLASGVTPNLRAGQLADLIVSELQGRFYEQSYRGNTYRTGSITSVALSANSITSATGATGTPIVGVWNPASSGFNLSILQASLQLFPNTLTTPVGCGPLVWLLSTGNTAQPGGAVPFSMKTLAASGSVAKGFIGGVALTGLTNVMVAAFAADLPNMTSLTHGTLTAVSPLTSFGGTTNIDGSIIVPPGGVLGLYNVTSTATLSAAGTLLWAEVPL